MLENSTLWELFIIIMIVYSLWWMNEPTHQETFLVLSLGENKIVLCLISAPVWKFLPDRVPEWTFARRVWVVCMCVCVCVCVCVCTSVDARISLTAEINFGLYFRGVSMRMVCVCLCVLRVCVCAVISLSLYVCVRACVCVECLRTRVWWLSVWCV